MSIKFQDGKLNETAMDFEERLCVAAQRLLSGYWDPYLGDEPFFLRDDSLHEIIPYHDIIANELISIVGEQKFDMILLKLQDGPSGIPEIETEQWWVRSRIDAALRKALPWTKGGRSMKKGKNPINHSGPVFGQHAEDKSYKRYKYICYGNLILKGLLFFALGILCAYFLQL